MPGMELSSNPTTVLGLPVQPSFPSTSAAQLSSTPISTVATPIESPTTEPTEVIASTFMTEVASGAVPTAVTSFVDMTSTLSSEVFYRKATVSGFIVTTDSSQTSAIASTTGNMATATTSAANANGNHPASSKKLAEILVLALVAFIILAGLVSWWLHTRYKEKKRVDELAAKAMWMDQEFCDKIRAKMTGMDEAKVGSSSSTASGSPISRGTTL